MARRESDNEPDLLTGMWVVEGPVPGIPREFVGGVIDFDTETGIRALTPWEVEQFNGHRHRLRPLSSQEADSPASAARAARRPSGPTSTRRLLKREK